MEMMKLHRWTNTGLATAPAPAQPTPHPLTSSRYNIKHYKVVIKVVLQTEVKEEPLDIEDDPEWERAAEAEILAANEGYLDTPSPEAASARNCPLTRHLTSNYLSSFMN